jgi:hypothetical protein
MEYLALLVFVCGLGMFGAATYLMMGAGPFGSMKETR